MRTLKTLAAVIFAVALPCFAFAQTNPNLTEHQVLTPAQWNNLFASKQDTLGFTPMNVLGGTFSGRVVTAPPGASTSGLNLTPGTTPGSPANGDIWITASGFFARVNGTTLGPIAGPSGGSFSGTPPISVSFPAGVITYAINNGTSVLNPGTGTLEALLPIQTVTGASKAFATADLYKETRRSNSGAAMSDMFPASSTTGLVHGTKVTVANVDATASDTITAGAGTTISGTGIVGPGRAIQYVYDATGPIWRPTLNTGTALLGPNNLSDLASAATARINLGVTATGADTAYAFRANNLSDLASAATARINLGLGSAAVQNIGTSGANVPLMNGGNTWSGLATYGAGGGIYLNAPPSVSAAFAPGGAGSFVSLGINFTAASASQYEAGLSYNIISNLGSGSPLGAFKAGILGNLDCYGNSAACWGAALAITERPGFTTSLYNLELDCNSFNGAHTSTSGPFFGCFNITGLNDDGAGHTGRATYAIAMGATQNANALFTYGIMGGYAGYTSFADSFIFDNSNTPTSFKVRGSHVTALDLQASFSGPAIIVNGVIQFNGPTGAAQFLDQVNSSSWFTSASGGKFNVSSALFGSVIKADYTTGAIQIASLTTAGPVITDASGNLTSETAITTAQGGFGSSVAAANGAPLFASGVPTFTSTSGTGNFVRVTSASLVSPTITGGLTLSAALTYGGVTLSNSVTGTGSMALSGSPNFTGTAAFANLTSSGGVAISASTASTSTTTGALTVVGGIGVGGSVFIGANLNVGTYSGSGALLTIMRQTFTGSALQTYVGDNAVIQYYQTADYPSTGNFGRTLDIIAAASGSGGTSSTIRLSTFSTTGVQNPQGIVLRDGVQIGTPTGGDKGAGSINISGAFYANGVAVAGTGTVTSVTGGTGLSGGTITGSGTIAVNYAAKSDQQAGSSAVLTVSPLHQQDHPSASKAWGSFNSSGGLLGGYNVTAGTHVSSGVYTVNFTTVFATSNYTCSGTAVGNNTVYFGAKNVSNIIVNTVQLGSSPIGADVAFDIECYGTQ